MRLSAGQLATSLSRSLAPLYLLSGDEPLLVDEALGLLRARAREDGLSERSGHIAERGFDWAALRAGLDNLSLFASGQMIELRLPTGAPGNAGSAQLVAWSREPPPGTLLVVITPALNRRAQQAAWVKAIESAGVLVELKPPQGRELLRWLAARLARHELRAD
jgi:DNA polymerase III subunit delta